MSENYPFYYHFHPVGQGLFASGAIYGPNHPHPRFRWVYDCGTSSSQTLIQQEIASLAACHELRNRLGLVTLSHFDKDHISGICDLIAKFTIDTLLLPYMPLWKRLLIAFEEGTGPTDDLIRFFLNPAGYLRGIDGANVTRIVFVQPGGRAAPSPTGSPPSPPSGDDPQWEFRLEEEKLYDPKELQFLTTQYTQTQVGFLCRGATISVPGLWEFVPYNDDPEQPINDDPEQPIVEKFRLMVAANRRRLLHEAAPGERANALAKLKALYDRRFGHSSEKRNVISLFLYGGPIYDSWRQTRLRPFPRLCFQYWPHRPVDIPAHHPQGHPTNPAPPNSSRCSVLYTGDGYLDTPDRLGRMTGFFRQTRIDRTGAFQVMHHGARRNWRKGVAKAIAPQYSIFSSDPDHKRLRHPHAQVLRDFWPYGSVQVDKHRGAAFAGYMVPQR